MWKKRSDLRKKGPLGRSAHRRIASACLVVSWLLSAGMATNAVGSAENPTAQQRVGLEAARMFSPFRGLVGRLTPSVVSVKVSRVAKADFPSWQMPPGPFWEFFQPPRFPQGKALQGAGSGVIISPDGTILTNHHVVDGAREVDVILSDKGEFKARIIGRDPRTDLAVLKIDAGRDLPAASLGDSDALQVGDWVLAIGNPFGLNHTVTSGIVSGKGRVIGAGPYDDFIQTDASINPGNSGGPLFNLQGEVVGINTAIISHGQGIGFAIPANTAKPLIPQLVADGKVSRGYLGVHVQPLTSALMEALNLGSRKGTLVAEVVPGGPAEEAGILPGDVIVSFDGIAVEDNRDLVRLVGAASVGKDATVTILRDGRELKLKPRLASLDAEGSSEKEKRQPEQGKWGLQLQDLTPQLSRRLGIQGEKGVVVVEVRPGSPAHDASISPGDVIVEVNRKPVRTVKEVMEEVAASREGQPLLLLVKSENGSRYVILKG